MNLYAITFWESGDPDVLIHLCHPHHKNDQQLHDDLLVAFEGKSIHRSGIGKAIDRMEEMGYLPAPNPIAHIYEELT